MRNIFTTILMALAFIFVFNTEVNAQITMGAVNSTKASTYLAKDSWSNVAMIDSSYYIVVKDIESKGALRVSLGDNKDQVLQSLNALVEKCSNLKNKEYITITDNEGTQITLYKWLGSYVFSTGDAYFIKNNLNNKLFNATIGNVRKRERESDAQLGYVKLGTLKNAVKKLEQQ